MENTINALNRIHQERIEAVIAHINDGNYDTAIFLINEVRELEKAIEALQQIREEIYPDSSNIYWADYDRQTKTLRIRFHSDTNVIYAYYSVPIYVWEAFQVSSSKGKYFNRMIKSVYDFERFD